jgi:hypothetical protein
MSCSILSTDYADYTDARSRLASAFGRIAVSRPATPGAANRD